MSIFDFPNIPDDLVTRVTELGSKIKNREIPKETIIQQALEAMGRVRIDNEGIHLAGGFGKMEFDSYDFKSMIESLTNLVEFIYILDGKQFLVQCDKKIEKITLGLPPKTEEVKRLTEKDEELALVEFEPDASGNYPEKRLQVVLNYLKDRYGAQLNIRHPGFKIHRIEEFAGWMKDWKEFAIMMNITFSLTELTTKRKIMQTGESAFQLAGDILNRCGV